VAVLPVLEGAFSLVLLDHERLIGVRDPHGFRPLCLGKLDQGWVLASETPALDITGAHFVRELEPGELLVIDHDGPVASVPGRPSGSTPSCACSSSCTWPAPTAACTARSCTAPGSAWASCWPSRPRRRRHGDGRARLGAARGRGLRPAQRHPLRPRAGQEPLHRADVHRPRPGPAGPGRAPQAQPAARAIAGQRLVVVDDSIVRGTTTRAMVACCGRRARPRSTCGSPRPPYRWPCYYGLDTGTGRADRRQPRGRRDLRVPRRRQPGLPGASIRPQGGDRGAPGAGFCDACLTGDYPRRPGDVLGRRSRSVRPLPEGSEDPDSSEDRGVSPGRLTYAGPEWTSTRPTGPSTPCATWWPQPRTGPACWAGSAVSAGCSRSPRLPRPVLVSSTDGVGTKMAVAMATGRFDTVGIDWSPCAWTTWCAAGPGRFSSSTTSCSAGSTRTRSGR
jgi:hypothetical protein